MHDSRVIANRILDLAAARGDSLTPMQVLKLVYLAHGWMLGLYGRPLIADPVEAWRYGPVIPKLYEAVREYGGTAVTDRIAEPRDARALDPDEARIVEQTYDVYGGWTGGQLSALTHEPGSPWSVVYQSRVPSLIIPQDTIESHYRARAGADATAAAA